MIDLIVSFGNFLYFPEDKTEYIPASISLAVFAAMAFLAFRWFKRVSRKEEEKAKQLEEQIRNANRR